MCGWLRPFAGGKTKIPHEQKWEKTDNLGIIKVSRPETGPQKILSNSLFHHAILPKEDE
jgi:hypothetical protein